MSDFIIDKAISYIETTRSLYYSLVLFVGQSGSGKTSLLRGLAENLDTEVININLEVSSKLLELTQKQRSLKLPEILGHVAANEKSLVIIDNIEILFDKSLQQDPLRLLQGMSRNKTILSSWNGQVAGNKLIYARADHPEYRSYKLEDLVWISME